MPVFGQASVLGGSESEVFSGTQTTGPPARSNQVFPVRRVGVSCRRRKLDRRVAALCCPEKLPPGNTT